MGEIRAWGSLDTQTPRLVGEGDEEEKGRQRMAA